MAKMVQLILLLGLLLATTGIYAAEPTTGFTQGFSASYLVKLIAALLLVLLAFFVFAWIARRINSFPGTQSGMQILGAMNVGSREKLLLVQVGQQQLLLGVTAQSINTLHELAEPIHSEAGESAEKPVFSELIQTALSKKSKAERES